MINSNPTQHVLNFNKSNTATTQLVLNFKAKLLLLNSRRACSSGLRRQMLLMKQTTKHLFIYNSLRMSCDITPPSHNRHACQNKRTRAEREREIGEQLFYSKGLNYAANYTSRFMPYSSELISPESRILYRNQQFNLQKLRPITIQQCPYHHPTMPLFISLLISFSTHTLNCPWGSQQPLVQAP